jgi:epoxyqueuosine reductase
MPFTLEDIKGKASSFGFNIAGVIPAQPVATLSHYYAWVEAGHHADMGYLARPDRQARRADLSVIMPDVRSLLLVGMDYRVKTIPEALLQQPERGRIASYAWGLDYHDLMTERLEQFADWLQREVAPHSHRVYVDTGAILERAHAQEAGMGFIGKNTMLIHPRRGSFFFIGEILTSLEFPDYSEMTRQKMCGNCTRCLNACPTDAFVQAFTLDAGRCISYLTIENKWVIPRDLRPLMGNWVYGCDVCQDVCPWNRFMIETTESHFIPSDIDRAAPRLIDLLQLDNATFQQRYKGSPIPRIKRERLVRNACVATGNWGDDSALPYLEQLLYDESPLVRAHAVWAVGQIMRDDASKLLTPSHRIEHDPIVLDEYKHVLE